MSYTPISSTDRTFFTREKGMLFTIRIRDELTHENVEEVKRRIERLPFDRLVIQNGIDIRHSFSHDQQQEVLMRLDDVTQNDCDFCKEKGVILLSKHILVDYLQVKPEVLVQRGWATDQMELLAQLTRTLIDTQNVEKAMIHFTSTGMDRKPLTYTVLGNDEGKNRKTSIAFQSFPDDELQRILVVTVLHSNEKQGALGIEQYFN